MLALALLTVASVPTVAVLPTAKGVDVDAAQLHAAIQTAVRHRLVAEVTPYNAMLVHDPRAGSAAIRACGTEPDCLADAASEHGADLIVVVRLERGAGIDVVAANAVDDEGRFLASRVDAEPLPNAAEALTKIVIETLLDARIDRAGFVRVEGDEAPTTFAPPPLRRATDGRLLFAPGHVTFEAQNKDGRASGAFDVRAAEETVVEIVILREQSTLVSSPLFWSAAVSVVAVATAVIIVALPGESRTCFTTRSVPCP